MEYKNNLKLLLDKLKITCKDSIYDCTVYDLNNYLENFCFTKKYKTITGIVKFINNI